jgi:hypothetical protein
MLAAGEDVRRRAERLAGDAAVLLRQEIHREVDAVEVAAGDRQVARRSAPPVSATASYSFSSFARIDRATGSRRRHGRRNGR